MLSYRTMTLAACLLSVAWPLAAQDAPAPPKIEPVLGHIPAGAAGFVVISNLQTACAKAQKFLADLGVDDFLRNPQAPEQKMKLLDMVRAMAQLGEGFNPQGGLAAVLLNPKDFGIDIEALIKSGGAGEMDANGQPKGPPKLPALIYLPGSGIDKMLAAYTPKPQGKFTVVTLPFGPMFAMQIGGYVVLSPSEKALELAAQPTVKIALSEMPAAQVKLLSEAEIAYHVNMKVVGPLLTKAIAEAQKNMPVQAMGPAGPLLKAYVAFAENILSQTDSATVAARIGDTGLVFDELVAFKPGSDYARSLAAARFITGGLNLLPDQKYVVAGAGSAEMDPNSIKLAADMVKSLLAGEAFKNVSADNKARAEKLAGDMLGQLVGVQFVLGGAPAGSGLFGADFVLQVKDAEAFKKLIAEDAALVEAIVKQLAPPDVEDLQKLRIQYVKGADTVGATSVDAVVIESPALEKMNEKDRAEMKKLLGEDVVRFRVAAVNKNTVVVTFGGGVPFTAEALKAASGKGGIAAAAAMGDALKYLPKQRTALVLFDAGNLYELIVSGMKTMEPGSSPLPFQITCHTPVFFASGVTGGSAHIVAFIPTDLIRNVVDAVKKMQGGGEQPAGGTVKPGDL